LKFLQSHAQLGSPIGEQPRHKGQSDNQAVNSTLAIGYAKCADLVHGGIVGKKSK
jgi:hypothetical protein